MLVGLKQYKKLNQGLSGLCGPSGLEHQRDHSKSNITVVCPLTRLSSDIDTAEEGVRKSHEANKTDELQTVC